MMNTENMVHCSQWVQLKDYEAANALPPRRIRSAPNLLFAMQVTGSQSFCPQASRRLGDVSIDDA
jgi:hypothetical protein